jgi:periplasmic protein CpxP/Spy
LLSDETGAGRRRHFPCTNIQLNTLMKNFSKIILIACGAALCALPVLRADDFNPDCTSCQKRKARAEQFKHQLQERGEKMSKELGLSAEQKAQMKAIVEEQVAAAKAVRENAALTPEQKQEKIQQLRQDFKARRMALLTPEQQQKAKQLRAEHQAKRQQRASKSE